ARLERKDLAFARILPAGLDADAAEAARPLGAGAGDRAVSLGIDQILPRQGRRRLPHRVVERAARGLPRWPAAFVIFDRRAENPRIEHRDLAMVIGGIEEARMGVVAERVARQPVFA